MTSSTKTSDYDLPGQLLSPVAGKQSELAEELRQKPGSEGKDPHSRSKAPFLVGVFLISFVNLLFELLLSRIISVTMAAQFAFIAISIVMCGMTIGALVVFLMPSVFKTERTTFWLSLSALLFGLTEFVALWLHLRCRFENNFDQSKLLPLILLYAFMSVPFICSGICICLALSRYPNSIGKTYAADLCGAAFACLTLPMLLGYFDGVSACIFVAALSAVAALLFAIRQSRRLVASSLIAAVLFGGLSLFNVHWHPIKIKWAMGRREVPFDFESWNSYSRLSLAKECPSETFYWSKSSSAPAVSCRQMFMQIDASAGTTMPFFDGNLRALDYLKFDFVNAGHYLKKRSNVLVIGVGGARDVLTALVFGARKVTGVEINDTIVNLLQGRYSNYNQVARDARVHLVNEDARSYLTRTNEKYDFIHLSLVDTFAATSSGALTFTENSIYTVEAWRLAIRRLSESGIFSISYWYRQNDPVIFHRLVYMAAAALQAENSDEPRKHLIVLANKYNDQCIGTILICRSPFTEKDIAKIREVAHSLNYQIVFDPIQTGASADAKLLSGLDPLNENRQSSLRLAPPTDDCPFPFAVTWFPWGHLFNSPEGIPLVVAFAFTVCGIFLPLLFSRKRLTSPATVPLIVYFTMIGLGFIFFEMSQMQKFSIFLGHPTLSLTVILGTLLLSSGFGSFLIQTSGLKALARRSQIVLCGIVLGLVLYQYLASSILGISSTSAIALKVLVSIALISPMGILMGMALPLGMDRTVAEDGQMMAWMWGVNGAASVLGSVIAVLLAMNLGITLVCNLTVACYGLALLSSMTWGKSKEAQIQLT